MYDAWWDYMKTHYYPIRNGEVAGSTVAYHDPLVPIYYPGDHEPYYKLSMAKFALPRFPDDAHALFESGARSLNWRTDRELEAAAGAKGAFDLHDGMFYARETGDDALYAKLKAHSEVHHEPTWDNCRGEFYWGFGLDEPHPRGQLNASAIAAAATTLGSWRRLINEPNLRKFIEPSVYGVDFPTVGLSQAYYDVDRRALIIATDRGAPGAAGKATSFRVKNIDPGRCAVEIDGRRSDDWRAVDGEIEIATTVGRHAIVVRV